MSIEMIETVLKNKLALAETTHNKIRSEYDLANNKISGYKAILQAIEILKDCQTIFFDRLYLDSKESEIKEQIREEEYKQNELWSFKNKFNPEKKVDFLKTLVKNFETLKYTDEENRQVCREEYNKYGSPVIILNRDNDWVITNRRMDRHTYKNYLIEKMRDSAASRYTTTEARDEVINALIEFLSDPYDNAEDHNEEIVFDLTPDQWEKKKGELWDKNFNSSL